MRKMVNDRLSGVLAWKYQYETVSNDGKPRMNGKMSNIPIFFYLWEELVPLATNDPFKASLRIMNPL